MFSQNPKILHFTENLNFTGINFHGAWRWHSVLPLCRGGGGGFLNKFQRGVQRIFRFLKVQAQTTYMVRKDYSPVPNKRGGN